MTWLHALGIAAISGLAGLLLAGVIADRCVRWYRMTSREGASGYFVLFSGIGGGIAGLLIGFIAPGIVRSRLGAGFGVELLGTLGVDLLIAGIVVTLCRLLADVPPTRDGRPLTLEVEFRFPDTITGTRSPTADGADWVFRFSALAGGSMRTWRVGEIGHSETRVEQGRWIVPAHVELFTSRGQRSVTLERGNDTAAMGFLLPVPARPGAALEQWSDWLPRQRADGTPWPSDQMSCRFRVQKAPLPPPRPTEAEWRASEDAKTEAAFNAIALDAPLQVWLPYLDSPQPQTARAIERIANSPNLATALGRLATGDDAELAGKALRCIEQLPAPTADLIEPVAAAGKYLIMRMRGVNKTPKSADPSYEAAAYVSIRFSGWMCAVRTLREKCGADFTPELGTMLELSRVRPDSHSMRMDVCRVASFYMHEWTGLAPLPDDPKPR